MDALEALHQRVSVPRLVGPAPTDAQCQALFKAALRAPDHAWLRPWRFLLLEQQGLVALGEVFVEAALQLEPDLSQEALTRLRGLPQRAPLIIVAVSRHTEHPKVPVKEQDMSCAVAVGNMLVAAHAMGLGAVWRTGELAYSRHVCSRLGLANNEHIIAFLYLGHPAGAVKSVPDLLVQDFVQPWTGS